MIQQHDVLNRLGDLLRGTETLRSFHSWLVGASWDMQVDSDRDAIELVGQVELAFAEYTSGHLLREGLLKRLQEIRSNVRFTAVQPQWVSVSDPASQFVLLQQRCSNVGAAPSAATATTGRFHIRLAGPGSGPSSMHSQQVPLRVRQLA